MHVRCVGAGLMLPKDAEPLTNEDFLELLHEFSLPISRERARQNIDR